MSAEKRETEGQAEAQATGKVKVSVKSIKTNREVELTKNFGADLGEAVDLFGEETVFTNFRAAAIIKCQSAVRRILDNAEKTPEDAIAEGEKFIPGVVSERKAAAVKDPFSSILELKRAGKLSDEELRAKIAEILGE